MSALIYLSKDDEHFNCDLKLDDENPERTREICFHEIDISDMAQTRYELLTVAEIPKDKVIIHDKDLENKFWTEELPGSYMKRKRISMDISLGKPEKIQENLDE